MAKSYLKKSIDRDFWEGMLTGILISVIVGYYFSFSA